MKKCGWVLGLAWGLQAPLLLAHPMLEPTTIQFDGFQVDLQEKMASEDVLQLKAFGTHSSSKNHGLRLRRLNLVWERLDQNNVVVHVQPVYQRIFGKESMDYIRNGVPFRVNESFPIQQPAKRYVVKWRDQEETVLVPVSAFASKNKVRSSK